MLSSCGGGASARRGDELCALLDATVQERVNLAIADVLPGASLDASIPSTDSCDQRFVTVDGATIDLEIKDVSEHSGSILRDAGNGLATDGVGATSVVLDGGTVVIVATSSDPASISAWDASLAAATALRG